MLNAPPNDLLVYLAVQRHGADDWPHIAGVVGSVIGALGYGGASDALGAAACERLYQVVLKPLG